MNYNTFTTDQQESISQYSPVRYNYPIAIPPDPLERYGSGHLDQDIFGTTVSRLTILQQMVFVRKVMIITTSQALALNCMVYFIAKIIPLFKWLKDSTFTWWIPLIPLFLVAMVILWQLYAQYFHLSDSTKTTLLSFYSTLIILVTANIVAKLIYEEGILAIIMTASGLCCTLLYTFQTKFFFQGAFPFVCSLAGVCLSSPYLRYVYDMNPLEILFPITIASVVCIYINLELYYLMKNVTSDDYILANIYFFVDLMYPIRFLHHFCELTDNMNIFPDILYPGEVHDE